MKRYAIIRGARDQAEVEAYLPNGYRVIHEAFERLHIFSATAPDGKRQVGERTVFVIEGEDYAGWTLDDYVLPRIASSGNMGGEEIDLSHPIMKSIPA